MSQRRTGQSGLSLLEVLIASVLLLTIALAIIPLFMRAMQNNLQGSDESRVTQHAAFNSELYYQLGFTDPALTVPDGATELTTNEVWREGSAGVLGDEYWIAGTATNTDRFWRTVTVRQYNVNDISDDGFYNTPLDGSTQPIFVHLKEVEVMGASALGGSSLGDGRRITTRYLLAF